MGKKKGGGRSMILSHRGQQITVVEGLDGTCELRFRDYRQGSEKTFPGACREAMTWLLTNAGEMQGNYERDES